MSIETRFHAHADNDKVSAFGSPTTGSVCINASRVDSKPYGDASVAIWMPMEKAREVQQQLAAIIDEHDLIQAAKAQAKAQAEAA